MPGPQAWTCGETAEFGSAGGRVGILTQLYKPAQHSSSSQEMHGKTVCVEVSAPGGAVLTRGPRDPPSHDPAKSSALSEALGQALSSQPTEAHLEGQHPTTRVEAGATTDRHHTRSLPINHRPPPQRAGGGVPGERAEARQHHGGEGPLVSSAASRLISGRHH